MGRLRVLLALAVLAVTFAASMALAGPRLGLASAPGGLQYIANALSGLPNNAAWQGVANDGTYWYVITSQAATKPPSDSGNEENTIRKYRISDGELVLTKTNAYSTEPGRFSSGEVLLGKLYVAVRHRQVGNFWGRIAVFDTDTLEVVEAYELSDGNDGGAFGVYGIPEGIDYHDGSFWVAFSGLGGVNNGMSAVGRYDTEFNEVAVFDLFQNTLGHFGAQDISWISADEIVINIHDGSPYEEFQRWRWTGSGFTLDAGYEQLDDTFDVKLGQGFTWLDGYVYFAARVTDRIVKAELLARKPTPTITPTPTKQPDPGDTDGDGCSDQRENGPDETLGGQRDYKNPHDFYDVLGGGGGPPDRIIDLSNDIFGVIIHYAPTGTEPTYDVNFDRGPSAGPNVWNMGPPDGVIDLTNDILGVIQQYLHSCQ